MRAIRRRSASIVEKDDKNDKDDTPVPRPTSRRPLRRDAGEPEQQDQRDDQRIDDQRLDQDETKNQRAADVARRARVARNGFGGRRDRPPLAEPATRRREPQRKAGGDHGPHDEVRMRGPAGLLRIQGGEGPRRDDERRCPQSTFAHDRSSYMTNAECQMLM